MQTLKRIASAFLVLVIAVSVIGTTTSAGAAEAVPSWAQDSVDTLASKGVVQTPFKNPNGNLTRAELSKMAVLAAGIEVPASVVANPFPDVSKSEWYATYISKAKELGIVGGRSNGYFDPNGTVTRAEAAKILVGAFKLSEKDEGPSFPDVTTSSWEYKFVETAKYWGIVKGINGLYKPSNPVTRSEVAVMVARTVTLDTSKAPTTTDSTVTTPTTPTQATSDTSLSVRLSPETPAASNIPANGYTIPYTKLEFTAGAAEGAKITQLIVTRSGLGNASDFASVRLTSGTKQYGGEKTINSTQNIATFNLTNDPIIVPKGSKKVVTIVGDMCGYAAGTANPCGYTTGSQNKSNILGVQLESDISAIGDQTMGTVKVSGLSSSIFGNAMTSLSVDAGKLITSNLTQIAKGDVYIGEKNKDLVKVEISPKNEDADFSRITFRQAGSAGAGDVGNYTLYMGDQKIAGPVNADGNYITFDFADAPVRIQKSDIKNVTLKGDFIGGINSTYGYYIEKSYHVGAVGTVYGYTLQHTANDVSVNTRGDYTTNIIKGGKVNFASLDNLAKDVAQGAKDFPIAKLKVTTAGDKITVKNLPFTISYTGVTASTIGLSDVRLYNSKGVLVSSRDVSTVGTLSDTSGNRYLASAFNDYFDFNAATSEEYTVTARVDKAETSGLKFFFTLGATAVVSSASATTNGTSLFEDSNGNQIASTDVIGLSTGIKFATYTVAAPTLTVTTETSSTERVAVKGTKNVLLRELKFSASSASSIKVTSLYLTEYNTASLTSSPFNQVWLEYTNKDGVLITSDTQSATSTAGTSTRNINFSLSSSKAIIVPAGENVVVRIKADVADNASMSTGKVGVFISAAGQISAEDKDGSSVSTKTGSAIQAALNPTDKSEYVAVKDGGKLIYKTITKGDSDARPKIAYTGMKNVTLTKFQLKEVTGSEDIYVSKLRLSVMSGTTAFTTMTGAEGITDLFSNVYLYEGEKKIAVASKVVANNTFEFTSFTDYPSGIVIKAGTTNFKTFIVKADINSRDTGIATRLRGIKVGLGIPSTRIGSAVWNDNGDNAGDYMRAISASNTSELGAASKAIETETNTNTPLYTVNPVYVYASRLVVTNPGFSTSANRTSSSNVKLAGFKLNADGENQASLVSGQSRVVVKLEGNIDPGVACPAAGVKATIPTYKISLVRGDSVSANSVADITTVMGVTAGTIQSYLNTGSALATLASVDTSSTYLLSTDGTLSTGDSVLVGTERRSIVSLVEMTGPEYTYRVNTGFDSIHGTLTQLPYTATGVIAGTTVTLSGVTVTPVVGDTIKIDGETRSIALVNSFVSPNLVVTVDRAFDSAALSLSVPETVTVTTRVASAAAGVTPSVQYSNVLLIDAGTCGGAKIGSTTSIDSISSAYAYFSQFNNEEELTTAATSYSIGILGSASKAFYDADPAKEDNTATLKTWLNLGTTTDDGSDNAGFSDGYIWWNDKSNDYNTARKQSTFVDNNGVQTDINIGSVTFTN